MKRKVGIKGLIILIAMFFSIMIFGAINKSNAAEIVGTWDISADDGQSNVTATLYDDGNFIISGTGEIKGFEDGTDIGYFENISEIKKATVKQGVTNIGKRTFYGCINLTEIEIYSSVTKIGTEAFGGCSSLTSIEIPEGVTIIGEYAFKECRSLTSINIPEGVTIIRHHSFEECSNLTSIEIPASLTGIEDYVFSGCKNLVEVKVNENNQYFCCEDGILYDKNKKVLILCPAVRSGEITILEGVTSIRRNAFDGCSSLTSITIPEGVTSIEAYAFNECSSLTSIEIPGGVTSIESGLFYKCSSLTSINIPEGVTRIGWFAFYECCNLTNIEIPEGVTSIEGSAFSGCSGLTRIEIPVSVTSIEYSAFSRCSSLTSINIPEGVTSIGAYTFYECSSLTSIKIPQGVISIEEYTFYNCSNLTNIEIQEGLKSIGRYAFYICNSITSINIPEGVTIIGESAFYKCSNLTSINLPEGLTSIGEDAFSDCSKLTGNLVIPEGVTSIGRWAFHGCSSLTGQIKIPEGVTSIEDRVFEGCSNLTNINMPNVTSIGSNAFSRCMSLETVEMPSITKIKDYAFYNCRSLTSIEIPEGVISIGENAFLYCDSLTIYTQSDYVADYAQNNNINYVLDKITPEINVVGNLNVWTKENIIVRITDGQTAIKRLIVNGNEEPVVDGVGEYTITENGVYTIEARDKAGNITTKSIEVTKIDKEQPILTIGKYIQDWTKDNIVLNITATDNLSGLAHVKINGNTININEGCGIYNISQNGRYVIVATDNAGNTETKTIQIYNIDKEAPTLEVTGNPTEWTKEDVTLSIETTDGDGSGIESITVTDSKGNVTEIDKNNKKYIVRKNDTYIIKVRDKVGNENTKIVTVDKIDKEAPTLEIREENNETEVKIEITAVDSGVGIDKVTLNGEELNLENNKAIYDITEKGIYEIIAIDKLGNKNVQTYSYGIINLEIEGNPTEWIKGNVNLTIKANKDEENINNVTVNGTRVNMVNGQGTYTVEQNGTYEITATYSQEETRTTTVEVTKIDKESPIINSVEGNPSSWTKENVTLKVNAEDNLSGLANEAYSFDGGETWQGSNEKTYEENTENIIIKVRDNLNNIREYSPISITKIDKEAPVINRVEGNPSSWTKENVTLKVNAEDNLSGLANEAYSFDGGTTWQAGNEKTYEENTANIVIKVRDNLNNIREYSPISITKIDKKSPVINSVEGNPTEWTKENVTLKVNAEDSLSGLADKAYSFDGGTTWQASNEKTFTENKLYIVIKVKDKVGNIKQHSLLSITKIDKEAPTLEIREENNETGVKIEITAVDSGVGIDKLTLNGEELNLENNKAIYDITEKGIYEIIAIDKLGNKNVQTYSYGIINLEIEGNPTEWTKGNVNLTIKANKDEENINNVTVNGIRVNMVNGQGTYTVEQNGTYEITATDSQGKTRTETVEVTKIDKEGPTINGIEGNPSSWVKENVTLKVNAEDNLSGLANDAYSFDGGETWQENNEKIYTENTENIIIKVRDNVGNISEYEPISITKIIELERIEIKQQPNKREYIVGENFDTTGMKVVAIYNSRSEKEIENYEVTNGQNLQLEQTSITISYTEKGITKTVQQEINVTKEEAEVTIKKYEEVKENGVRYIEKVMPETSIEELKRNIETNGAIDIYNGETKIADNRKIIGTGMEIRIRFTDEEIRYKVVVTGDLTGDGKMGIGDLSKLSRYAAGLDNNLIGAYLRASDIVKDGKYGRISDISKMSRVLAGLDNL